ncbi:hypothetical protein D9757_010077 [Collybiopsis confluens]|uniref:Uncharacterized protein n=1 Tax=Collybiopsis confluens TaxID=2823264 RepID=A0A8H5GZW9_9AGAR|nr:hypothetical protein D9757_010077 [Collybiopsis confluens]
MTRTLSLDSDLVSSFQRNFCSNFVCVSCYVHLPSLHDLYDHLDAAHNMGPSGPTACQWPPKVPPLQAQVQYPDQIPPLHIVYSTLPQPSVDQLSQSTLSLYEDTFNLDYFTFCDIDLVEYPLQLQLQPSALPPVVHQLPVFVPLDGNRTRRRRDDVDQPQPRPRGLESERVDVVDPRLAGCHDIGEDSVRRIQRQPRDFNDLDSETEFDSDERESQIGPIRTLTRLRPRVDRNSTNGRSTSSSTPTVGAGILEEQVAVRPAFTSVKKKPASSSSESVLKKTGKAFRVGVGDIKCPTYKNLNGLRYHQKHGTCVIEAEATIKSLSESELAAPIHGVVSPDRAYSVQPAPLAGPPSRRPPSKSPSSSPSPSPYQLVDVPPPLPRTPVEDSSYPVNTMIPIPIPIPIAAPVPVPIPVPVPAPPPALMDYLPPPPPPPPLPPRILLRDSVHSTSLSSCFILL